jgi:hypothetical protein
MSFASISQHCLNPCTPILYFKNFCDRGNLTKLSTRELNHIEREQGLVPFRYIDGVFPAAMANKTFGACILIENTANVITGQAGFVNNAPPDTIALDPNIYPFLVGYMPNGMGVHIGTGFAEKIKKLRK